MKKLIEQGIVHIVALPEPDKVGLFVEAIVALDISHERLNPILEELGKHPQVRWLAATTGRFDILAHVQFRSNDELFKFIEGEIGRLEGVRDSETFIYLHVEKRF